MTVTEEDIARGWQLCEVRTNCNVSYTMPEDAKSRLPLPDPG